MASCYTCKKKFDILKFGRKLCKDCELYFCRNCMATYFGDNCKICKILNTRPVNRSSIANIRPRELKMYLTRRRIQTDSCIEKEDLIQVFFNYVNLEPQLKKKRSNYKELLNSKSISTPNLLETKRDKSSNDGNVRCQTPPTRTQHVASGGPTIDPSVSGHEIHSPESVTSNTYSYRPEQHSEHSYEEIRTNASALTTDTFTTPVFDESTEIINDLSNIEHIKLSNICSISEIPTLTIKQLKVLLMINRVDYKGCVEKHELRNKVIQLWTASQHKEDLSGLPMGELCKICMDAPLNSVLLECGHIATCIDCGKQLAECPICRQYVVRCVHTFKA